ncbi:MAG: oxidoreductase [Syntrophomonas sp.]|nr:oxidoreductase [Syntrophomonas sp.]
MMKKRALLFGASGLVGGELLKYLLEADEYEQVAIIVRKDLGLSHPKLLQVVADFSVLSRHSDIFAVSDIFCCLGTTANKTRDKKEYKKIDVDYPLEIARLAMDKQVQNFLVVSAMGANKNSKVFYNRIKGLLEDQLIEIGLPALHIFRPSLLTGARKEFRLGEKAAIVLTRSFIFMFTGPLRKYRPISAETVAKSMYAAAQTNKKGVFIYNSNQI